VASVRAYMKELAVRAAEACDRLGAFLPEMEQVPAKSTRYTSGTRSTRWLHHVGTPPPPQHP